MISLIHRHAIPAVCLALLAATCPAMACAQGTLSSVRETLTTPRPEPAEPTRKKKRRDADRHHHHHDDDHSSLSISFNSDDDCDDDSDSLLAKVFLMGVTSPFWLPMMSLEDDTRTETNFASFPYNHNHDGYLMFGNADEASRRHDTWAIRVLNEYGTDFDNLDRYGGRLLLETSSRFGVDLEWNQWFEDLGLTTDELWTGDVNLIVRFAQSEHAQFRAGVGLNWLADETLGTENGFNFTYGFDLFPSEPFVIETTLDWGRIDSSTLFHARSTVGVVFEHVELFTGYDYRTIDDVDLSGFVTGLTVWW